MLWNTRRDDASREEVNRHSRKTYVCMLTTGWTGAVGVSAGDHYEYHSDSVAHTYVPTHTTGRALNGYTYFRNRYTASARALAGNAESILLSQ